MTRPAPDLTHYAVLDFEATCERGRAPVPQEVIEFPTVLMDARSLEAVDEFSTFVRPTHHPRLSGFCTELTSIMQTDVDDAPPFREVFDEHVRWLAYHGLSVEEPDGDRPWAFVTCGDWDLKTLFPVQRAACDPPIDNVPAAYARWINIKRSFSSLPQYGRARGMQGMLAVLGLELEGRHHRGIDDCRNIARIVRALAEAGVSLTVNGQLK